jgi:phosphoribosylformylglycinamidine synthase
LTIRYQDNVVCDLPMGFLHDGRPDVTRKATFTPPLHVEPAVPERSDFTTDLLDVLHDWDVASKEWIVRQYDHEVQARTVLKPMVGVHEDGPGDAAVIQPVRGSHRGLAISCGISPRYGEMDPYLMAGTAIDEAVRNCVAVGADPSHIALLDNFCWGSPERPETLGSLVLAAMGCHDLSKFYGTPFISGKDSLYNEYAHDGKSLAIPPTLLISAMGRVPDVRRCVTMDLKEPGNVLFVVGHTRRELGGSVWLRTLNIQGGSVPRVDPKLGLAIFKAVHVAISRGFIRSCHDLGDGGLAAALAEMALAGELGADVSLRDVPCDADAATDATLLFAESPSRFVIEVPSEHVADVMTVFGVLPIGRLGEVVAAPELAIRGLEDSVVVQATVDRMKASWKRPLHDGQHS